ncbi:hypothetical protein EKPJFOCH_4261 [Methylobacterium thuringiense]|uniref:Uncharacterized protein n=1 Tax=Methylobacterium thuringiense TaxID=1003091 RepID=A0ABQ4TUT8_9HYPH|nr:hypothetical protein EKPJFOCH_4261 [Methylobacterium thuringiense]
MPVEGSAINGPYPPDSSDLQRRIKENPDAVAAEAKAKLHTIQAGYRRDLYALLAMIVGVGRHYYLNYKAWKLFFDQPFFQTGKIKPKARTHHTDALRHTMNFVFDAKSKQARSRTGKYAAALREIMILGVPVHLVAQEIEQAGGIEKLYEAHLEREAHKPKEGRDQARTEEEFMATAQYCNLEGDKAITMENMTFRDLEDGGEEESDVQNDGIDGLKGEGEMDDPLDIYEDAELRQDLVPARGRDPDGRLTVELEATGERQERFLGLRKGKRFVIYGHCPGRTDDDWQRLKIDQVIWKPRSR